MEKNREREKLLRGITEITMQAEVAQALSLIDLALKYKWAMSNADLDIIRELKLTGIKKYWRRIGQVEMKLD